MNRFIYYFVLPPVQFRFLHSSFRQKEQKEKFKALWESKDEELREVKMRYLGFARTSDLFGQMHTAIQKSPPLFIAIRFLPQTMFLTF